MAWVGAVVAAGTAIMGGMQARSAAKQAAMIGKLNADADWEESMEAYFRMHDEFRMIEGQATATAAASGLSQIEGDSQQRYIKRMTSEHRRQLMFHRRAMRSRRRILLEGGTLAYKQGQAEAVGQFGQALQNVAQAWSMYQSSNTG